MLRWGDAYCGRGGSEALLVRHPGVRHLQPLELIELEHRQEAVGSGHERRLTRAAIEKGQLSD